jgi:hypothetical protein
MSDMTNLVTIVAKFGYNSANDAAKTLIQLPNDWQYYVWYYWYDNEIIPPVGWERVTFAISINT